VQFTGPHGAEEPLRHGGSGLKEWSCSYDAPDPSWKPQREESAFL
jgi:hypothetical protein